MLPGRGNGQEIPLVSPLDDDPDHDRIALSDDLLFGDMQVRYRIEHTSKQAGHVFGALYGAKHPSVPFPVLCEELADPVRILLIEDALVEVPNGLEVGFLRIHGPHRRLGDISRSL